jgi:signal transduction histidine kinase
MIRLVPRSLAAQMALLLGLALLVAQLVNFALILNERQKLSLAQTQDPAITRFANVASDFGRAAPDFRQMVLDDASHRGARFAVTPESGVAESMRDARLESRLQAALANLSVPGTVRAAKQTRQPDAESRRHGRRSDVDFVQLAVRRADGQWLSGQLATPRRDPWLTPRLVAATVALYLIVLGATVWIALRLALPLRALALAAERFGGRSSPDAVPVSGPSDLRHAIEAFNAMNLRVLALLDEKDRMLGAIGHDLRTPLASLRIRVESMEPDQERDAAIAKIEEMAAMLEDILVLARSGRAREAAAPVDIAALAEQVVEDRRAMGQAVTYTGAEGERVVATAHQRLLRRAIDNLVDNAVSYGGGAEVKIDVSDAGIAIRIADTGPGIPAEESDRAVEPFYRLEASRNRETGGSGLGLAIARSIAESHGGRLVLTQNDPSGLIATIVLPPEA